ncbi:MAG: CDC27 family protein [Selenomonadales bacterium]|nr:CDC27 family protein [Selenomonadales bacterium]
MMGKRSRKIKRSQQSQKNNEIRQETKIMKAEITELLAKEKYVEVIEELAKMIQAKCYDADTMYAGAFSYFMLGDYKRASDWANNTLTYDPQNINVRILLARLCFLEDRVNDGLAVCNFVMQYYSNNLNDEQQHDLEDLVSMYIDDDGVDKTIYPYLLTMINDDATIDTTEEAAASPLVKEADSKIIVLDIAKAKCQEIMQQQLALTDKVKLLNSFAASFYLDKDFASAELLLAEALRIDMKNDATLRNMVMTQLRLGNIAKAKKFATEMTMADFILLDMIAKF